MLKSIDKEAFKEYMKENKTRKGLNKWETLQYMLSTTNIYACASKEEAITDARRWNRGDKITLHFIEEIEIYNSI